MTEELTSPHHNPVPHGLDASCVVSSRANDGAAFFKVMKSEKIGNYTYLLIHRDSFYIGVRSCNKSPWADKYLGSGVFTMTRKRQGALGEIKKHILNTHRTRAEAEIEKSCLIAYNEGIQGFENKKTVKESYMEMYPLFCESHLEIHKILAKHSRGSAEA